MLPLPSDVLEWVNTGVRIPINASAQPFHAQNKFPVELTAFVTNEIQRLCRLSVVKEVSSPPFAVNALKTAPKSGSCPCKTLRLVVVGTQVDKLYSLYQKLRLKVIPFFSMVIPKDAYMVTIDLSDFYLHFMLHQDSQQWMGFQLNEKFFLFLATMFRFKISAFVAAKTSLELAKIL